VLAALDVLKFPLTEEDKERARKRAEEAVELYAQRMREKGRRLGIDREYERAKYYRGYCGEESIARILNGTFPVYDPYRDWDVLIPGVGKVQVKTDRLYRLCEWEVRLGPSMPFEKLWLCYLRESKSDIQRVSELSVEDVRKYPWAEKDTYYKLARFYKVTIPKDIWLGVEE